MDFESEIRKDKSPIVILHGWGLRGSVYSKFADLLENDGRKVYTPDLPGFGAEPLKSDSMVLDDYVEFVHKFVRAHKINNPILIGHSFGGRIAVKYSWRYPQRVSKLVLTGVPIIRHKSMGRKIAFLMAVVGGKILKIFPRIIQDIFRKIMYKSIGEWDYYKAGKLKQVFKNIIGEELTIYAKEIKIPVLLAWGEQDMVIPVTDIKEIKKYIPQAKSIMIANTGHKLPYLNSEKFFKAIKFFL